jgi:hypothetical protein
MDGHPKIGATAQGGPEGYFFDETVMTVLTFPRGLKSPITSMERGFNAFSSSAQILFMTASCEIFTSRKELRYNL